MRRHAILYASVIVLKGGVLAGKALVFRCTQLVPCQITWLSAFRYLHITAPVQQQFNTALAALFGHRGSTGSPDVIYRQRTPQFPSPWKYQHGIPGAREVIKDHTTLARR